MSALEVIFFGVVTIADLSGLSLTQDSGTPPTFTGVSGSGSHEHRFGLDPAGSTLLRFQCNASLDIDLHPVLVVTGINSIRDLQGRALATVDVGVGDGSSVEPPPSPEAFASVVNVIPGVPRRTYSGPVAPVVLLLGEVSEPASLETLFPASSITGLTIAPEFNLQPGAFLYNSDTYQVTGLDLTKPHCLFSDAVGEQVVSALVELVPASTATPTVQSATVNLGAASHLVIATDIPVYWQSIGGLSLTGTSLTITGILSGDGTTAVTFSLSGSFTGSETAHFVVGSSRAAVSIAGNVRLPTSSSSVAFSAVDFDSIAGLTELYDGTSAIDYSSGALAATIHNAAIAITANGGTDWTLTQATPAKQGTVVTSDSNFANRRSIGHSGSQPDLQYVGLGGLPYVSGGFTRFLVVRFPLTITSSIGCFWAHGQNLSPTLLVLSGELTMYDTGAHDMYAVASVSAAVHMIAITVSAAGHAILYVDGVAAGAAVNVGALANAPENWIGNDESQSLQSAWACGGGYNRVLSPTEMASLYAVAKNNPSRGYGLS